MKKPKPEPKPCPHLDRKLVGYTSEGRRPIWHCEKCGKVFTDK